jgi:hypothetical protein
MQSKFFLWGGLTFYVIAPGAGGILGLTFAGILMAIGFILLVLGK